MGDGWLGAVEDLALPKGHRCDNSSASMRSDAHADGTAEQRHAEELQRGLINHLALEVAERRAPCRGCGLNKVTAHRRRAGLACVVEGRIVSLQRSSESISCSGDQKLQESVSCRAVPCPGKQAYSPRPVADGGRSLPRDSTFPTSLSAGPAAAPPATFPPDARSSLAFVRRVGAITGSALKSGGARCCTPPSFPPALLPPSSPASTLDRRELREATPVGLTVHTAF